MNEKLKFRLPTAEDAAEYISYRQAFLDAGSSMDGTGPMRRTPDPMEWLAINAQYADPATVPEGKVQSMQFVCERVSDGRIVGMLQVRLALNDYLLPYLTLDSTKYKTIPILIQYFRGGYGHVELGPMMACIMMVVIPIVIMYILCQKYIIDGVVAGAVKG